MNITNQGTIFLNWLLPCRCELCLQPGHQRLCSSCVDDLPLLRTCCAICALPLPVSGSLCGECQQSSPQFDQVIAAYHYAIPLTYFINHFKRDGRLSKIELMLNALVDKLALSYASTPTPDIITSVPIHWTTTLKRGFNQSELIARVIAKRLNLAYQPVIAKTKPTAKQQNLSRKARLQNLKNAFAIKLDVEGKHIALVDDVVTTGATAETLAGLLKKKGAAKVDVWTLARTPKT